jgi:hypothetical protein
MGLIGSPATPSNAPIWTKVTLLLSEKCFRSRLVGVSWRNWGKHP